MRLCHPNCYRFLLSHHSECSVAGVFKREIEKYWDWFLYSSYVRRNFSAYFLSPFNKYLYFLDLIIALCILHKKKSLSISFRDISIRAEMVFYEWIFFFIGVHAGWNGRSNKYLLNWKLYFMVFGLVFFFAARFLSLLNFMCLAFSINVNEVKLCIYNISNRIPVTICLCCFAISKEFFFLLIMQLFQQFNLALMWCAHKNFLCCPFRFFKRIFYASTIFNIKLINRHWTRDNMMLKHIIYVSIFSLCSWLSFAICVSICAY